jgi:hypothetical protein
MTAKKTTEPSRVINPDGSLAPRPGAGVDPLAPAGLPPKGAVSEPHSYRNGVRRDPDVAPLPSPDDVLPFVGVARAGLGKHVTQLKITLAHVEREIECTNVFGVNGPNTYQLERVNGLRETSDRIRGEIAAIGEWSDDQVRLWARDHGYR